MSLSQLANTYFGFQLDNVTVLVATTVHPNPCWNSYLQAAPGLLPDPVTGGQGQAPVVEFHSDPPSPGTICIQVRRPVTVALRQANPDKPYFVVQDGHGFHQVPITQVP